MEGKSNIHISRVSYLVEVRLQEVCLLSLLQKSWPVFRVKLLLSQHKLHISFTSLRLTLLDINFTVEIKLDMIGSLFAVGVAGERQGGRFQVDLA